MRRIIVLFLIVCISNVLLLGQMSGSIVLAQDNLIWSNEAGPDYIIPTPTCTPTTEPNIYITSPQNGSNLRRSSYTVIPIEVSIKDTGKAINKVEFYKNDELLGFSDTSPYTFNWEYYLNGPVNDVILKAKVIYTDGTFSESPLSNVRISIVGSTWRPTPKPTPVLPETIKISGYIEPDHVSRAEAYSPIKSEFIIKVEGFYSIAYTDSNGYFEISALRISGDHVLTISKPGYLTRTISKVNGDKNIRISSKDSPLELWAGDVEINRHQDNAVNMIDIMEIAKGFNTVTGDERYNSNLDYNKNNAINMFDIMVVAKNFNKVSKDYPDIF